MRPPSRVTMGPHRWRIVVDVDERLIAEGCHGTCIPRRQLIVIDGALEGTAAAEVVLHELIHAALAGTTLEEDVEELVANAAAGPLLHALRANPALVRFLTT